MNIMIYYYLFHTFHLTSEHCKIYNRHEQNPNNEKTQPIIRPKHNEFLRILQLLVKRLSNMGIFLRTKFPISIHSISSSQNIRLTNSIENSKCLRHRVVQKNSNEHSESFGLGIKKVENNDKFDQRQIQKKQINIR